MMVPMGWLETLGALSPASVSFFYTVAKCDSMHIHVLTPGMPSGQDRMVGWNITLGLRG